MAHILTSRALSSIAKNTGSKVLLAQLTSRAMSNQADLSNYKYETLEVSTPGDFVLHIELNRPDKLNAMTTEMWKEMVDCYKVAGSDENVRSIIFSGKGRIFTAGLDLMAAAQSLMPKGDVEAARRAYELMPFIRAAQDSCTVIEKCLKPTICAIHGACIGGGIDLITACDIRFATDDAYFSVKEVDVGLAADVGTLQRLPKVVGNNSLVRELCYTARKMPAAEAMQHGLLSRTFPDKEAMMTEALEVAKTIASKSPVAIQGTKHNLNFSRDHPVDEGLEHMVIWNAAMLQTEDLIKSAQAAMTKQKLSDVVFSKL